MPSFAECLPPDQLASLREIEGDEINPETLTVDELRAEIQARQQMIDEVTEVITENDTARKYMDQELRRELLAKRRIALTERKALHAILVKKTQTKVRGPKPPTSEEAHARRMAYREADERRNRHRAVLFVKAAHKFLDRDQFDAIWAHAKELFPDSPAWAEVVIDLTPTERGPQ
jgi:hypothetical protein